MLCVFDDNVPKKYRIKVRILLYYCTNQIINNSAVPMDFNLRKSDGKKNLHYAYVMIMYLKSTEIGKSIGQLLYLHIVSVCLGINILHTAHLVKYFIERFHVLSFRMHLLECVATNHSYKPQKRPYF